MDISDKILLSQTGSAGQDWAGGLKPHFCSISFGNPISPLTNRLCSLPAPGMWHYLCTGSSSTLAASLLLPPSAPPSWRGISPLFWMCSRNSWITAAERCTQRCWNMGDQYNPAPPSSGLSISSLAPWLRGGSAASE